MKKSSGNSMIFAWPEAKRAGASTSASSATARTSHNRGPCQARQGIMISVVSDIHAHYTFVRSGTTYETHETKGFSPWWILCRSQLGRKGLALSTQAEHLQARCACLHAFLHPRRRSVAHQSSETPSASCYRHPGSGRISLVSFASQATPFVRQRPSR